MVLRVNTCLLNLRWWVQISPDYALFIHVLLFVSHEPALVKKKMNKLELAQIWAGGHESKERVEMEKRRLKPLLTPMPLAMCSGAEGQKPISSY